MSRFWQVSEDPICGASYCDRRWQAMRLGSVCDAAFRTACANVGLDWERAIAAPIDVLAERQTQERENAHCRETTG